MHITTPVTDEGYDGSHHRIMPNEIQASYSDKIGLKKKSYLLTVKYGSKYIDDVIHERTTFKSLFSQSCKIKRQETSA